MRLIITLYLCTLLVACGSRDIKLEPGQEAQALALPEMSTLVGYSVQWSKSAGSGDGENSAIEPYVGEKTVFLTAESGAIRAFNIVNGKLIWFSSAPGTVGAGVGVGPSVVVIGLNNGELIAYDRDTGEQKWRHNLGRIISARPVVSSQTVIVRTQDGNVYGLHGANGEPVWGLDRPIASLSVGRDGASKVAGEGVLTGFSSGRLLASSLYTGETFWEKRAFRPKGKNEIDRMIDMDATPLLVDTDVIVGAYQGGIASYKLRDGELNWRNEEISTRKDMFAAKDKAFVTQSNGAVSAVSIVDGNTLWTQSALIGRGVSSPVIYNDQVIVGGLNGSLFALDVNTGELLGKTGLGKANISSLHLSGGSLLVYARSTGVLSSVIAQ